MSLVSHGRQIRYLRLSITDKCNLRCRYCMPEEGLPRKRHDDLLRVEETVRLLTLFRAQGIDKLRITGGEPLVSRRLYPLLQGIKTLDFQDIALTTNGQLLTGQARQLKTAGVRRLNISLDTLQPERFRWLSRGGRLQDTLDGITAALKAGFQPVKVNCVLMRGFNEDEIQEIAALAQNRPISVRFIEFMPLGKEGLWSDERFLPMAEARQRLTQLGELKPSRGVYGNGPADVYQIAGWQGSIGFIDALSGHFCQNCNRLRLTADGKLYPCLHSGLHFDFLRRLRAGADDAELTALIRQAVDAKPAQHDAWGAQEREMNTIGG